MSIHRVWISGIAALTLSSAVSAQDETPDTTKTEEERQLEIEAARLANEKAQAEVDKAKVEAEQAAQDLAQDKFSGLGNLSGGGETTLGEGAGLLEMSGLTSLMIKRAGAQVHKEVQGKYKDKDKDKDKDKGKSKSILILPEGTNYDFNTLNSIEANFWAFELQYTSLNLDPSEKLGKCKAINLDPKRNPQQAEGGVQSPTAILGAANFAAGLFKTDTELRGAKFEPSDTLLIASIASQGGGYIDPNALLIVPNNYKFARELNDRFGVLARCAEIANDELAKLLEGHPKPDKRKPPIAARIAALTAATTASKEFLRESLVSSDGNPAPITLAIREHQIRSIDPLSVLHVDIAMAHGSLLTRSNLFTSLGARAYAVSGGVTVSYRLTDPKSGAIEKSGIVVCNTKLLGLREAQDVGSIRKNDAGCAGNTTDKPPVQGSD